MSSELLRIHDENNNCDLVAVANPMGNFHMSTYAEMQDGTQKPVDGWYLFSKMIEKLGQGGEQPESNVLVVHIIDNGGNYTKDHTYAEIVAAFPNVVIYDESTIGKYQYISGITSGGDVVATRMYVEASVGNISSIYEDKYTISSDESIAFESSEKVFGNAG